MEAMSDRWPIAIGKAKAAQPGMGASVWDQFVVFGLVPSAGGDEMAEGGWVLFGPSAAKSYRG
jgi:hypothetical protein